MSDDADMWFDANGVLAERRWFGDQEAIVHYDDIPEKDKTVVRGIPCATALRTCIDCAADMATDELRRMIDECLRRGLFTVVEGLGRTSEPDICDGLGARRVLDLLSTYLAK